MSEETRKGIIYKATNKINGKAYIGQTVQKFKSRINDHTKKSAREKSVFHKAIHKYGKEAFEWEIIYNNISIEELDNLEKASIIKYNTNVVDGYGYNLEDGGNKNKRLSEETKNKIRQSLMGKKRPKEVIERISLANKGKVPWNKNKTHKDDNRILSGENNPMHGKIGNMTGKYHSKEAKLKMSISSKGKSKSEEHIKKMSLAKKGKKLSEDHKKKISTSTKGKSKIRRK